MFQQTNTNRAISLNISLEDSLFLMLVPSVVSSKVSSKVYLSSVVESFRILFLFQPSVRFQDKTRRESSKPTKTNPEFGQILKQKNKSQLNQTYFQLLKPPKIFKCNL